MPRLLPAVLLIAAIALPSATTRAAPTHESVNRALVEAVIMPAYRELAAAMAGLEPAIAPLCAQPSAAALAAARAGFAAAMDAWQHVQPVAFGPVAEAGRAARIMFWPDKHGTAGRQLGQALATRDPALVEAGVAGKSAALQSLATLERLLYDDALKLAEGTAPEARFACGFALAIARFQRDLAAEVLGLWEGPDGFLAAFETAAAGNARYFDAVEAQTDLLRAMVTSLEVIIVQKLEPPLGDDAGDARPKQAECWRSGRSLANISANLATLAALYTTPGGFTEWVRAGAFPGLDQSVRSAFVEAQAAIQAIAAPLSDAVADPAGRAQVETLVERIKALRTLMSSTVAEAAGITLGFNAMDGD